jgi:hypothetical protein
LPRAAPAALVLCWPQTFKELAPGLTLSSSPLPFRKRVQKYYLFPIPQALFSNIFQFSFISLTTSAKKVHPNLIFPDFRLVLWGKTKLKTIFYKHFSTQCGLFSKKLRRKIVPQENGWEAYTLL